MNHTLTRPCGSRLGLRAVLAALLATSWVLTPLTQARAQDATLAQQPHQTYANGVIGVQDVTYQVIPDFHPLKADLYLPGTSSGAHSIVIWIHGGGWGVGDPRMGSGGTYGSWPDTLAKLAARGHVVMAINYRFSGEARFPAQAQDLKAAIRWIRSNAKTYGADPSRIIVWGGSAGGYLAALAGTSCGAAALEPPAPVRAGPPVVGMAAASTDASQSDCVQGVVDWFGPIDFARMDSQSLPKSMIHNVASGPESKLLGCALPSCPAPLLQQANPETYISSSTPPFLIIQGTNDHGVPIQQSEQLYQALRTKNVPARLVEVAGADHMFGGASPEVIAHLIDVSFDWIDQPGGSGQQTVQSGAKPGATSTFGPPPGT